MFSGDIMGRTASTTEKFICKAKKVHDDKYDYSKVDYKYSNLKVIITCPIHGDFDQLPNNHLNGNGCPKCRYIKVAAARKLSTSEFILKANKVHGDKYDYSKVDYQHSLLKVVITCPVHGDFEQIPNSHLNGNGCPTCRIVNKKSNTEEFIKKANLKHNYKYRYDKVDYKYSNLKVIITCPIHGDFEQKPNCHLNGTGCPRCKESKGEKRISEILDKYEIPYKREFKILNQQYEYDFYLPNHHLLIEFHGVHHYKAINFFGGEERLEYTRKCDEIKVKLAKKERIPLIVFNYMQFNELSKEEFETLVMETLRTSIKERGLTDKSS